MSPFGPSLTLARFFALVFAGTAALILGLVGLFYAGSRRTVLVASERLMAQSSRHVVELITRHLGQAESAVDAFEARLIAGLVRPDEVDSLEADLVAELLRNPELTEATFTNPDGQTSAVRASGARGAPITVRRRPAGSRPDPTAHPTYATPAAPENRGRILWSDLSYSQLDDQRPEPERRRVVTVQKGLVLRGQLVGVLRIGLLSDRVDALARLPVEPDNPDDPHRLFVCDRRGRLVTRLDTRDTFALVDDRGRANPEGDDLRVLPVGLPGEVRAALSLSALRDVRPGVGVLRPLVSAGRRYLASFTALPDGRTQDWVVGLVVPEDHHLAGLTAARRRTFTLAGVLMLLAGAIGGLALAAMRRDFGRLIGQTARLRGFDFVATPAPAASFRDVADALRGLEQAKSALRALTRYVPLDLVRQLYDAQAEPRLGGELQEVTILFADVESFTSLSERLAPDVLATALGQYLAAMTAAVHRTGGIIDKYTGDGLMALWNTPRPSLDHTRQACEAALACVEAAEALFASSGWRGLPPWRTRFGIHRARVNVGHFGAPERMSFTAMGDGVNLASRLEGLNKEYGTRILVSAAVEREAGPGFVFRRLGRVAVKGRREEVEVFELCGRAKDDIERSPGSEHPA